jgi:peptidoglycan/LPS O-acetylase OafA/YrhL
MPGPGPARLVAAALRCYPRRWRGRHGDEAAEIAALLISDGVPAWSIAWSYLIGAASARLALRPGRRLGAAVGALLAAAGSLSVVLALSSPVPASAASVTRAHVSQLLQCDALVGQSVRQALPVLDSLHVKIAWDTGGRTADRPPRPAGEYYIAAAAALSATSVAIRVTPGNPPERTGAGRHGRHC